MGQGCQQKLADPECIISWVYNVIFTQQNTKTYLKSLRSKTYTTHNQNFGYLGFYKRTANKLCLSMCNYQTTKITILVDFGQSEI